MHTNCSCVQKKFLQRIQFMCYFNNITLMWDPSIILDVQFYLKIKEILTGPVSGHGPLITFFHVR